jgi:hypothetical protein
MAGNPLLTSFARETLVATTVTPAESGGPSRCWATQAPTVSSEAVAALGGKLELVADIGGHLLKMPANPAA